MLRDSVLWPNDNEKFHLLAAGAANTASIPSFQFNSKTRMPLHRVRNNAEQYLFSHDKYKIRNMCRLGAYQFIHFFA